MVFVVVTILTGCDTIATINGPVDTAENPGRVHGMFYHLPEGRIRIKGEYSDVKNSSGDFIITVTTVYAADPRHRYYLESQLNPFYDDDFKIHTNAKGLLETVNVTAEDRTADILGDIASTVGGAMKFSAGLSPDEKRAAEKPRLPFDYTFSPDEVGLINGYLATKLFDLRIVRPRSGGAYAQTFRFPSESNGRKSRADCADCATREIASGIVFRPVVPYDIVITDTPFAQQSGNSPFIRYRATVFIPDPSQKLLLGLGRTPFIKRTDNLVFVDGVLTKLEGTRPSPVLGFLQIPKKILTAIVPLPLEIRNTQVSNIKAQRELEGLLAPTPTPTATVAPTSTVQTETKVIATPSATATAPSSIPDPSVTPPVP
jgi:hypothetical protein